MATNVVPVAKAVYLSDDVIEDPQSRKVHLLGTFNAARPPGQPAFPYRPRQICVFAQLVGGVGEAPIHVEIIRAATEEVIYTFPERRIRFPTRHTTVSACFRVRDCVFPEAGTYIVELYCNNTFLDDRTLQLIDTPGASP
jgi:Family of unknown function (DUF6941)